MKPPGLPHLLGSALGLAFVCALTACQNPRPDTGASHEKTEVKDEAHSEGHTDEHEARRVSLAPEAIEASGIEVAVAGPHVIEIILELPGEVVANADKLAHIVPRFPGIAREVRKSLGDQVTRDEVLAVIESNESLSPYEVVSLTSGTIIEKHITLGEFVRDDEDILVVADLSTVWVNITVYTRDLPRIRSDLPAHIIAIGGEPHGTGVIDYVGPVLGETTRAATARVVLPNSSRIWRPGMFVTARIVLEKSTAPIAVPDAAIARLAGTDCVFIEEGDAFEAHAVELGRTDGEWTEVLSGIALGERYVAKGAFVLKSELMKSEASHEH